MSRLFKIAPWAANSVLRSPFRYRRFHRCIIHRLSPTQPIHGSLQHSQVFGHRLSHLSELIRNFNHHLGHRTSRVWQHLDSLLYQIFEDLSSMGATPDESV